MMKRRAQAVWSGGGQNGQGTLSTQSGTLRETPYSARARFGDGAGTNPEELIAAAHAGCFSMALAFALGQQSKTAEEIRTEATVTIEQQGQGFTITAVHLDLTARIPGLDEAGFRQVAEGAKANCPVSKVLNAPITLDAKLQV
jgi:osmotically inducible protein OsmC